MSARPSTSTKAASGVGSAAAGFSDDSTPTAPAQDAEGLGEHLGDIEEIDGVVGVAVRLIVTLMLLYVLLKMLEILYGLPVPI